ncbi:DinB family protein [Winogradskyella sp. A3E31]|uniref:DinB family protein n=1 Tax=Winogradskyella sp. A3E31 TaxID=3349637 RepID=UPI00398B1997
MITNTLTKLFLRELDALKTELSAYSDEKLLWNVEKNISNSAGNLGLHLVGNLNHFIGSRLGNTGYIRQRDLEFSDKDVPLNDMLKRIDDTKSMISSVLSQLTEDDLAGETRLHESLPIITIEFMLSHLLSHLSYHLGQINYHRRLLDA